MSINIPRGGSDSVIERIIEALQAFESDHPNSQIDIYRQNSVSVRVRIIDPEFAGRSKIDRSKETWKYLDPLPEDVQSDISTLILLAPEETKMSIANIDFEDPIPSSL